MHLTTAAVRPPKRSVTSITTCAGASPAAFTAARTQSLRAASRSSVCGERLMNSSTPSASSRTARRALSHAEHVELVDAPELLGDVERLGRAGQPIGGIGTHQRLHPEQPSPP